MDSPSRKYSLSSLPLDILCEVCVYLDRWSVVSLTHTNMILYFIFSLEGNDYAWKNLSQLKLWKGAVLFSDEHPVKSWKEFFLKNLDPVPKYTVLLRFRSHTEWEINMEGDKSAFRLNKKNVVVDVNNRSILERPKIEKSFMANRVFDEDTCQRDIYSHDILRTLLDSFEKNYNMCYMSYGPTSTGKTRTLFGPQFNIRSESEMGIFPRVSKDLFKLISEEKKDVEVKFSMFQVYNEAIRDLMDIQRFRLRIKKEYKQLKIEHLSVWDVKNAEEVYEYFEMGIKNKLDFESRMRGGCHTSRAYLIVLLKLFDCSGTMINQYMFCESSGSEKVEPWEYWYAANIARSHEAFHSVINSLSSDKRPIPYREGKITRLLKEVIDPEESNNKMVLLCTASSHTSRYSQTKECIQIADNIYHLNTKT